MNFVDIQPESFLDYAWTSPASAPSSIAKPRKATRKQNRCCDQCRKGKRACDAAILEDTLFSVNDLPGEHPTAFHYSDVFGSLARCGNCDKTKKTCTFQWLRSQRVSQVAHRSGSAPPVKKRRTQSRSPQHLGDVVRESEDEGALQRPALSSSLSEEEFVSQPRHCSPEPLCSGSESFLDCLVDGFPDRFNSVTPICMEDTTAKLELSWSGDSTQDDIELSIDHDSGFQESPKDSSRTGVVATDRCGDSTYGTKTTTKLARKRRRRSSSTTILGREVLYPLIAVANNLIRTTNNTLLAESLLKVYQDSFEHHLSCWLTEKTCPVKDFDLSVTEDKRPSWNCVYHRVFNLDRLDRLAFVRGRALSGAEDKRASKALNTAIISFASQRALPEHGMGVKYPFRGGENINQDVSGLVKPLPKGRNSDALFQISAWHEARLALNEAEGVESFRIALALIVFSLTQKPSEIAETDIHGHDASPHSHFEKEIGSTSQRARQQPEKHDLDACQDMLLKLRIVIDGDGPPIYLEKGLRLLHSLRSRLTMTGTLSRPTRTPSGKKVRSWSKQLESVDRATVDLLFWLAMMFDTLSAAMYKRPLVVSLEDSDLPTNTDVTKGQSSYDDYLFGHQRAVPVRWPCSYAVASSLLCEAAPIKVLLFRKVTRIQSLLSRSIRGKKIEEAVQRALEVYEHWKASYAPFFQDFFDVHNRLPSHLRSWSICVTAHFYLATLLLADLIEIADDSEAGVAYHRRKRRSSGFIAEFRKENCQSLSDIARCACPQEDGLIAHSHDKNPVKDLEALLSEPWTVVLIRALATAGVYLLELAETSADDDKEQDDAFRRANDCICALWYLGRKSNMALIAARTLGSALKQRRKVQATEKMDSFVELWGTFEKTNGPFSVGCDASDGQ